MNYKTYNLANRIFETADIKRGGFVSTMLAVRSKFRASRGYGSMKTYYVRHH